MERNYAIVYINGKIVGKHPDGAELTRAIRKLRRQGQLPPEVNVFYNKWSKEVYINTDRGRIRRPYIVVENGKPRLTPKILERMRKGELTWRHLLKMGVIEYLDADEEENALIAKSLDEVTEKHTHVEIEPSTIFGVVAGILPFTDHNSSPRITMGSAMAKQSLGLYASNFNLRFDTRSYVMYYPQKPIVKTRIYDVMGFERRAAGQNFVVAVLSYKGWNMSDAVVVSKSAVDRGLARVVMFRTYETEENLYPSGYKDTIEIPSPQVSGYRGEEAYAKLDEEGIVAPETEVKAGDVLVGKTSPPRFLEEASIFGIVEEKKIDTSLVVKNGEEGKVDAVILTEEQDGSKLVKVRLRLNKIPEVGDKFASRHGQKGVIGLLVPHEDMPFTKDGIVPDLIINPHAIPSRMTVGHLLEMLGGKAGALAGKYIDGTPFTGDKEEDITKLLKELGFDEYGEEELYDGVTGRKMKAKIFVGVIYYQRLHHLVSNKIHYRSRGPVQLLTLQPTEGRSREGGLRFGEMERDCLIGHGASLIIKERLLDQSDISRQYVCRDCGSLAYKDYTKGIEICPLCKSTNVGVIETSYAFKLLLDEIKSLVIFPRLRIDKKANRDF